MSHPATQLSAIKLTKSQYPRCLRCDKRVDALHIAPDARDPQRVTVSYECHGERVSQEMHRADVENGLRHYTAFNAYTSGMLPHDPPKKQRNAKK